MCSGMGNLPTQLLHAYPIHNSVSLPRYPHPSSPTQNHPNPLLQTNLQEPHALSESLTLTINDGIYSHTSIFHALGSSSHCSKNVTTRTMARTISSSKQAATSHTIRYNSIYETSLPLLQTTKTGNTPSPSLFPSSPSPQTQTPIARHSLRGKVTTNQQIPSSILPFE